MKEILGWLPIRLILCIDVLSVYVLLDGKLYAQYIQFSYSVIKFSYIFMETLHLVYVYG